MESKRDAKNNPETRTSFVCESHPCQGKSRVETLQLVGVHVGGKEFALDILRVQEIIRLQELTRVPSSPEFMDGVMNLRGKIVPVITLRTRFGLPRVPPDEQTRIVILEVKGSGITGAVVGVIVDSVSEVLRIPADSVECPPFLGQVEREYVSGVGKIGDRLLLLLNMDRLMEDTGEMHGGAAAHLALTPERNSL
jgi:purine-binding chemotaxis protein CheW